MKILSVKATNFGSYPELEFSFENVGLGLIYGPTGAGKSTIQDVVPWVLFSKTAKDGNADEVKAWQAEGAPTAGTVHLESGAGEHVTVTRTRGPGAKTDFYFTLGEATETVIRGKDALETQKLLESHLRCTSDTYLIGAYFHEFSPTGSFFTAKAKDRREVLESVTNLQTAVSLEKACAEHKKVTKADLATCATALTKAKGRQEQLLSMAEDLSVAASAWAAEQETAIEDLEQKAINFDKVKSSIIHDLREKASTWQTKHDAAVDKLIAKLEIIQGKIKPAKDFELEEARIRNESRCATCGSLPKNINEALESLVQRKYQNQQNAAELKSGKNELRALVDAKNPYEGQLAEAEKGENLFSQQIEAAKVAKNPHKAQLAKLTTDLAKIVKDVEDLEKVHTTLTTRHARITRLYDLSFEFRGQLLNKRVREIESSTNRYLETYFDSEIRVKFSLVDGDSIEVGIQKSGYDCSFRQLSKGQRSLLRLAFVVSIMNAVSDASGVHFGNLFFDESLDGLDESLKLKAFRLFQELAEDRPSVLVIDHAQGLHQLFGTKYKVEINGDVSTVSLESEN